MSVLLVCVVCQCVDISELFVTLRVLVSGLSLCVYW